MQRRFTIYGHVQGVGFRWWTRSHARRLGIFGEVRNRPDGSVEVRARGTEEALDKLKTLLEEGAPGASVTRVEQEATAGIPETDFDIAR